MKIRSDFVTNSSSSSFVRICIYDDEFYEFPKQLVNEGKAIDIRFGNLFNGNVCSYFEFESFYLREEYHKFICVDAPDFTFSSYKKLLKSFLTIEREDGWYDEIDYLGNSGTYDYYGIRPAIWVSIEN